MEQWGNLSSYNLENVLRQNILNSEYYRDTCVKIDTWSDVVDEIYETVEHVEPWMSGNARGASTAFCLLYRLFTLKPSVKEIKDTITHRDSPYIRAVGFLYLRYVCDPKNLWSWCSPYVSDREEFSPSPGGKTVTMGDFVRDILLEQYYFETIFPRIPKKAQDEIIETLGQWGLPTTGKGNGGAGGGDRRGMDEPNRRPPSVKASLSVAFGQRAPNRAGAREEGRGRDPSATMRDAPASSKPRGDGSERQHQSRSPEPYHGRDRDDRRDDRRDGVRGEYRSDRGRDAGERGRDADRGRGGYRDGGRPPYDRNGDSGRQYERAGEGGRGYERAGPAYRSRSRSAERQRGRPVSPVRSTRDVFKDRASGYGPDNEAMRDRYGDRR